MLPDPLHPAVVHLPMALAVLLPLAALWALWALRRDLPSRTVWALPVVLAGLLTLSAWASLETGENEEERVEEVVGEANLHEHEERAELFLVLSGAVFVVLAGGLLGGTPGRAARIVGTVGTLAVLVAGLRVGASGGELVWEHGAASAYVETAAGQASPAAARDRDEEDDEGR